MMIPPSPHLWFRSLPRAWQWTYAAGVALFCGAGLLRAPAADEPAHAVILSLIVSIVLIVVLELVRPKPDIEDAKPLGLGDIQRITATEGRFVPLIWGRNLLKGANVVWTGDLAADPQTKRFQTGLWSSTRAITGYQYRLGMQFGLCRGTDAAPVALRKVRIGETEVFDGNVTTDTFFDIDEPGLYDANNPNAGGVQATCDFYTGTTTQAVSPFLDTAERQRITTAATPTAPRYTGTCYVIARELTSASPTSTDRGAYVGNSPQALKQWQFEVERFPGIFSGQGADEHKIGSNDSNPVNVVYEILTNAEWGFGASASEIDVGPGSSFLSAADTMITESNGFAMVLDREMSADQLLKIVQEQMDGLVFISPSTGLWTIKLAREDYDIDLVPQLTDSTVSKIENYTRGSWQDTANQIVVRYDKRDDNYKQSHALAHDMANALIQGDRTVTTTKLTSGAVVMPGVKNSALAATIAWRELRQRSFPLARAVFVVNRSFWDVNLGDVVAWTNSRLGFTKLPMRVLDIDYGTMQNNDIKLTCVQDVFGFAAASMGTPATTRWTPPTISLVAYPSAQQLAYEAPRGILIRDPEFAGDDTIAKVHCAARQQSGEVGFEIRQRNSSGTPGGSFGVAGEVQGFVRIGELAGSLSPSTSIPTSAITVDPTPDSQALIEAAFNDDILLTDLGQNLAQLIMVNDEFMLVTSASDNGGDVDLENVYRGVLDSVQAEHSAGDDVFLLFLGSGLTDVSFPTTNNVDIELRAKSVSETFEGSVTTISLTMAKRVLRPYPPARIEYNSTNDMYGTPDLEDSGVGMNGQGFDVNWRRRRFNTTDEVDELLQDNTPDSSTEYRIRAFVDPAGVNSLEHDSGWIASTSGPEFIERREILNGGAPDTLVRFQIETRHDIGSEVDLEQRTPLTHDVVPDTVRSGQFYLGGDLSSGVGSTAYTVATAGVHQVRIGTAYSTANVEHRINGGAWSTIISAGGTSGNTASLSISDTIEVRVDANDTPSRQLTDIRDSGLVQVAVGVFTDGT